MLDKECIQSRGFVNLYDGDEVVGFQIKIRLLYYRGLWLSQIRPLTLTLDGEVFSKEQIKWQIGGNIYNEDEMAINAEVLWNVLEPATILVTKAGGLDSGYHDVEVDFRFSSSYMPPSMDGVLSYGSHQRKLLLV